LQAFAQCCDAAIVRPFCFRVSPCSLEFPKPLPAAEHYRAIETFVKMYLESVNVIE
jgi:hypothetical protein